MTELKISVVLPTHNNAQILPDCLRRILSQTLPKEEYEVIVIDDGSMDGTVGVLREIRGIRVQSFDKNSGPSAARNAGILAAKAPIIVFIQDDILVKPDFLEQHLSFHEERSDVASVLVGNTRFDPAVAQTPFMQWWEGKQFGFPIGGIGEVGGISYLNFYPTNLSAKREFLLRNGLFDKEFFVNGHIGYEDTELGYRLWQAGMRLYYNPALKVLHRHLRSLKDICDQSYYKGQLARILYQKHPELQGIFRDDLKFYLTRWFINSLTIGFLEPVAYWCESRIRFGLLFWLVCRFYYNKGYRGNKGDRGGGANK